MPARAEPILFKTPNSQLWQRDEFSRVVRLTGDAARHLVDRGVRLVGIDDLSVGDHDAHVTLLEAGIVVLEGLDLRAVEPGAYELICSPPKIIESDGAPARAFQARSDTMAGQSADPEKQRRFAELVGRGAIQAEAARAVGVSRPTRRASSSRNGRAP